MPCHASGHLAIYRESYKFERAFLTFRRFLPFFSLLLDLRLPWGRQFNLEASRVSCWSWKHSLGPAICLYFSNPQKRYGGRFYLWVTADWLRNEESASFGIWTLSATGEYVMLYPTKTETRGLKEIKALVFVVICVLEVLSCNAVMTKISIHGFDIILLWW